MKPDVHLPRFDGLVPETYRGIEHAASLKGLLKPFKGKGELEALVQYARQLELSLIGLMDQQTQLARYAPYPLLGLRLVRQNSASGSSFLRWRSGDFARMGVEVWAQVVSQPTLPHWLRAELQQLEHDRITLNLQMSVVHTLYRQAQACAQKMAHAERITNYVSTSSEESP
jgi:hypothetical protein